VREVGRVGGGKRGERGARGERGEKNRCERKGGMSENGKMDVKK
jgi:hypothetical protein